MKKLVCLILSVLMAGSMLTSCKDKGDSGKISRIVSNMYGIITPIDIYKIEDGYIDFWESEEIIKVEKKYNYCVYYYQKNKNEKFYGRKFINVHKTKYKITFWDSRDNQPADVFTYENDLIYFSEYFGKKENISLVANVSFDKTIHIKLEERNDTYKITYYDDPSNHSNFSSPIVLNNINDLDCYKKVIEVQKNDITGIEYIV